MVVGITLATIAILRSRRRGASFVDPDTFRKAVEKRIKDPERRLLALELVDSLSELAEEYDSAVLLSLGQYVQAIREDDVGFYEILAEVIRPLERQRHATLLAGVELRTKLRDLMSEEEWTKVFGKPEEK
jgi:hypothetical protein